LIHDGDNIYDNNGKAFIGDSRHDSGHTQYAEGDTTNHAITFKTNASFYESAHEPIRFHRFRPGKRYEIG